MPDIARLDETGAIIDVVAASPNDYKTDPVARTVALPINHDMHNRARSYRYDFLRGCFEPITVMGKTAAEGAEFVDALVDAIMLIAQHTNMKVPAKLQRALNKRGEL